jgi:hypothetical protein
MSTNTGMEPDHFEQLKSTLQDTPRDYKFLAEYVSELEKHRHEVDIFRRYAFEDANPGGAHPGTGLFVVSVYSELYEPLDFDQKVEIRRWWHEMIRFEANRFGDLKARLSKLL